MLKRRFINIIPFIFLAFATSCTGVAPKGNAVAELLPSLSGDYLKKDGIYLEYTVEAYSKDYAKYFHKLSGIPLKDIIYIDKNVKQDIAFYKDGTYISKDTSIDNPNDWTINMFDGKNYFSYSNEKKVGQTTQKAPYSILPNYFDILTKIPESINLPQHWDFYSDFLPADPDKISIDYLPNNDIRISFKSDSSKKNKNVVFDFYLKKQSESYLIQEICLFAGKKSNENLLIKANFSNYKFVNEIKKYLPFEIKVEYYTMEGELLLDGKTAHLDKVLERVDKIHVKKISTPSLDSLKIKIPDNAVIENINIEEAIH